MSNTIGLLALFVASLSFAGTNEPWTTRVHPHVLEQSSRGAAEYLVIFKEQAALDAVGLPSPKIARGRVVVETLRATAERSQQQLLRRLEQRGLPHRAFWIANMIWVRGDRASIREFAQRDEVRRIDANPVIDVRPVDVGRDDSARGARALEWSVSHIQADQLWAMGITGNGVVVGGQDTGYEWAHPALIGSYRGWDGLVADHDYNWHDSIHSGGGVCGADSVEPCDDHGHGTHTMGTMTGDDGGANQIGVSPGARWIGCRNMDVGNGTPASYAECFEWFLAPTDLAGNNPDPSRAPDVINNSWLCPPEEGCSHDTLQMVVENTRAAGIVVVVSAGNAGSACSTVSWPAAIYDASFSVGATGSTDAVASFSSRGPVAVDGSGRRKPDISAPGVGVRSSVPGGGYSASSGTSMAGPHVAAVVALLLDARPDLKGQVDVIESLLIDTAVPLTTNDGCGGDGPAQTPNNTYGHGRLDALALLTADSDGDGGDNLTDCRPTDASLWAAPGAVDDLRLDKIETELKWSAPASPGALALVYDLIRSESPENFSGAICLASGAALAPISDGDLPAQAFYYLVRARNDCGSALGVGSGGATRSAASCP